MSSSLNSIVSPKSMYGSSLTLVVGADTDWLYCISEFILALCAFDSKNSKYINYLHLINDNKKLGDIELVNYENKVGFGFQLGFDYKINDKLYWNVDVKKLYLNTDVTVGAALDQQVYVPADVDLNPWLISTGIGFKLF